MRAQGQWIVTADRTPEGYTAGLILPTRGGRVMLSAEVPHALLAQAMQRIARLHRQLHARGIAVEGLGDPMVEVLGDEVGFLPGLTALLPMAGRLLGGILPGSAGRAVRGLLGGGDDAPPRQQAPRRAPPPPPPPPQEPRPAPAPLGQQGGLPDLSRLVAAAQQGSPLGGLATLLAGQLGGLVPPGAAAPFLGAAQTLASASPMLAGPTGQALFGELQAPLAGLLRGGLQTLNTAAAAELGSPQARAALDRAYSRASGDVANALRMAEAFLTRGAP